MGRAEVAGDFDQGEAERMIGKIDPIRSTKLTQASKGRSCVNCGCDDGTIVRAHYSGIRQHSYGKGTRIKGHDCIAADLCKKCHTKFDGYTTGNGIDESEQFLHLCALTLVRDIRDGVYKIV